MPPRPKASLNPWGAMDDPELLAFASPMELRALRSMMSAAQALVGGREVTPWPEGGYMEVLERIGPLGAPMAAEHKAIWEWVTNVPADERCLPLAVCLPRGRGKSTTLERASVAMAAHGVKTFIWYVSGTQDQADKHLETIASLLESPLIERFYPSLGARRIGKYGNQRGWRRNRIWTEAGVIWEAVGLNVGVRGVKVEDRRPNLIILDDIDASDDTPLTTEKKRATLTKAVLPAGDTKRLAVAFVQNLVHANSLMARIVHPDDFTQGERWLTESQIVGPIPAVNGLEIDWLPSELTGQDVPTIVAGESTWPEGQPIEALQAELRQLSVQSFLEEFQHSTEPPEGGIFGNVRFRRIAEDALPRMVGKVVAIDPAVTESDKSDCVGISVCGVDSAGYVYALWAYEKVTSVTEALRLGLWAAWEHGASEVIIENNQGKNLWPIAWGRVLDEVLSIAPATDSGALPFILELDRLNTWTALTDVDSRTNTLEHALSYLGTKRLDLSGMRRRLSCLYDDLKPAAKAWIDNRWTAGGAQGIDGIARSHELLGHLVSWDKDGGSLFVKRPAPKLTGVNASSNKSKIQRVSQMVPDYERGDVLHVTGDWNLVLERALKRFPDEPDDGADAIRWAWGWCRKKRKAPGLKVVQGGESPWVTPGGRQVSVGAGAWHTGSRSEDSGGWSMPA